MYYKNKFWDFFSTWASLHEGHVSNFQKADKDECGERVLAMQNSFFKNKCISTCPWAVTP